MTSEVLEVLPEVQRTSACCSQTFGVNDTEIEHIVEDCCILDFETIVDLLDLQGSSFDLLDLPEVHHTYPPVASYWAGHPEVNSWVGHPSGPSYVGAYPCPYPYSSWAPGVHPEVHLGPYLTFGGSSSGPPAFGGRPCMRACVDPHSSGCTPAFGVGCRPSCVGASFGPQGRNWVQSVEKVILLK